MAVSSTYAEVELAGNGVATVFNFGWKILATSDLVVRKKDASGNYSAALTLGVDYTVSFDPQAESGSVTFTVAPVNGGAANIQRASAQSQATVWNREGTSPAKYIETAVDKLTLLAQEIEYTLTKQALLQPAQPPNPAQIVVKPPQDGKALTYSANGDGTFSVVPSVSGIDQAVAATAASAAAAAASAAAAAASLAAFYAVFASGTYAAKPAAPATGLIYFSTDKKTLELWHPAAGYWVLIG